MITTGGAGLFMGKAKMGETPRTIAYLQKILPNESKNSSIIFLGDNVYPNGLASKNDDDRELTEHAILQIGVEPSGRLVGPAPAGYRRADPVVAS